MDYLFENLGEDRFQELCQALLIKEFPNVQCFPIRQPDGGRDAVAYTRDHLRPDRRDNPFHVFQVKYVRRPLAQSDPHKWLLDTLEKEAPKLKTLIPKGAKAYYLLTNIPGTSHLDVGSIDKANQILANALKGMNVESFCWWRNDLNRRMDNAYDLKWVYPEIMGGTDLLRLIIETGLSEHKERRASAIKTFIRKQYSDDEDVKFKQIELHNKLLDLFVDVPVVTQINPHISPEERLQFAVTRQIVRVCGAPNKSVGAATALLNDELQEVLPHIVLEGAPGQGKSTLSQYVCQVHRMRILEEDAFSKLPKEHQPNSVRVPFKVDLRDLATWFSKNDPFTPEEKKEIPDQWAPSLEAFLAAQVHFHSGGVEFSVSDLHAVAKLSSILLVLDGLDEVADLTQREEVVKQIISGVNRLNDVAASLQVLITSRPTAFTSSVGFPEKNFPRLQLDSLPQPLILEYSEKWNRTQKLSPKDASNVIKIMKQKIEQPHLKDLARNPMQLSILLSLIHTHGPSLPDKRTALYDGYVSLFFKRESEKDETVRDNRELLIDLHRYLGWYLHSESEKDASKSRIGFEDLQNLLKEYLLSEERSDSSVPELFTAIKERIIFIVSRVQGTFEFEVQPLREYFAARHLYVTAPYSYSGSAQKGTLPDRFDGIVRGPYWLNVTRFFAGCFDKGELPCLIDRLRYLSETKEYRYTNHPQRLAVMLLGDWVFSEDQRATRATVDFVLSGVGLRHPLANKRLWYAGGPDMFSLPSKCGRDELVRKCFDILRSLPKEDHALEISTLVTANATRQEVEDFWNAEIKTSSEANLTQWLKCGLHLGTLSTCTLESIEDGLKGNQLTAERAGILLKAGRADYLYASQEGCDITINGILGESIRVRRRSNDLLSRLCRDLDPWPYTSAFRESGPTPLHQTLRRYYQHYEDRPAAEKTLLSPTNASLEKCKTFIDLAKRETRRSTLEWSTELTPWNNLVELSRSLWGESWINFRLANLAAGIKSSELTCTDFIDLFDHSKPICPRIRYARLRAGNPQWWKAQLEDAKSTSDKTLALLVFCTWASIPTVLKLADTVSELLDELPTEKWHQLAEGLRFIYWGVASSRRSNLSLYSLPEKLHERLVVSLGQSLSWEGASKLYEKYLSSYNGKDVAILSFCAESALRQPTSDHAVWVHALEIIRKLYRRGVVADLHSITDPPYRYPRSLGETFPINIAKQVAEEPDKYPRSLVFVAAERCQAEIEENLVAVRDISIQESWFTRAYDY